VSGLETWSIDYVPLNERHGKIWHLAYLVGFGCMVPFFNVGTLFERGGEAERRLADAEAADLERTA
jgi:hypothetical protein